MAKSQASPKVPKEAFDSLLLLRLTKAKPIKLTKVRSMGKRAPLIEREKTP
jgi:hypothetical protein